MEFASEMVIKATLRKHEDHRGADLLSPDGRSRPPHLRSWRDGWRHLRFMLLYSPRWLFLYPGIVLMIVGLAIGLAVAPAPLRIDGVTFDVDTLDVGAAMIVIGFQSVLFSVFSQVYASAEGFLPMTARVRRLLGAWSLERGLLAGLLLMLAGVAGLVLSFVEWHGAHFGSLNYRTALRVVVPSVTALILSCQMILGTFFLSILGIRRAHHPVAPAPEEGAAAAADVAGQAGADVAGPAGQNRPRG